MGHSVYITFDIGGTNTRIAKVVDGELCDVLNIPTAQDPNEGVPTLIEKARALAGDAPIAGACGDISGIIQDGVVFKTPHLPQWNGTAVAPLLSAAFSAPVSLVNDTELVGLGEYYYGAGKGESSVLYVTVSTGVGGALIKNGAIVRSGKYAMEIGHQIVSNGEELEELISGSAVQKKYSIHPKELSDKHILNELADMLAVGLYNSTLHLSPETIVLGGSMIVGENAIPLERTEETFHTMVSHYFPSAPRIKKATLGSDGGLYGGMACLMRAEHPQ